MNDHVTYHVTYQGKRFPRASHQSILECLLDQGVQIPYSCRSGVCCSCMMKSNSENIPFEAQNGLKETLKNEGYFLACVCKPQKDIDILDADISTQLECRVRKLDFLNQDVIRLQLEAPSAFHFKAGQYISLMREDQLARSYSIASLPQSGYIELHIRMIPYGKMSGWVRDSLKAGDSVSIRGPFGNCYYSTSDKMQPLLLVGTGTGLAPLYGILRDAINQGHSGPIALFHGGITPSSLYLSDELKQISLDHPQFSYKPCVISGETDSIPKISIDQYVTQSYRLLKTARIFLCGDPQIVNRLKRALFITGASSKEIYADAFLPTLA